MLNPDKAVQSAAFLLSQAGNPIPAKTMMALLYLSDRMSLQRTGNSISGDDYVSAPEGPMLKQLSAAFFDTKAPISAGWERSIATEADAFYLTDCAEILPV